MKQESVAEQGHRWFERAEAQRRREPRLALVQARRGERALARSSAPRLGPESPAWQRARLERLAAHCLRALGRHGEAVRAYARAATLFRRAGDRVEAARCSIGLIDALMYLGRYRAAEHAGSVALRVLDGPGNREVAARLLNNLANLAYRRDRPEQALALYARARPSLAKLGPAALGRVDANRSNCLALRGRPRDADRLLRAARRAFVQGKLPLDAAACDYGLAYLLFLRHRYIDALFALEGLHDSFQKLEANDFLALLELDSAEILLRLGRPEEAQRAAAQAAARAQSLGLRYESCKATYFEAVATAERGDLVAARELLIAARRGFLVERNRVWAAQCELALGECAYESGRPERAQAHAGRAAQAFAREADVEREGLAWILAVRAALLGGRPARSALVRARRAAGRARSAFLHFRLACVEGDVAFRAGRTTRARAAYMRGARVSETLAGRVQSELFRATDWTAWEDAYPRLVALELRAGRMGKAFHALERGRARAFELSRVGHGGGSAGAGLPAAMARQLEGLSCRLESRRWRRATLFVPEDPSFSPRPEEERRSARLLEKLEREALRVRGARSLEPVTLERLQRELAQGERLVELFEVEGDVHAVAVDREAVLLHARLASRAEVDGWLEEIAYLAGAGTRGAMDAGASIREALREVAARVVAPWVREPGVPERVTVVPAGRMAQLPWPALVREAAGRPLPVSAVPSASAWRELSRPAPRRTGVMVLVEAGNGHLAETRAEIESIARLFPRARVLTRKEARVERVRRALAGADWLHVAGHGRADAERPILSGVRLADRWAHVTDLTPGGQAPRGVVLSACRSGELVGGWRNDWRGLAGTLLASGAQAIVASLWDAEDSAARRWSESFYRHLKTGHDLGAALSLGQEELRAPGDPAWNAWTWGLFGWSRARGPRAAGRASAVELEPDRVRSGMLGNARRPRSGAPSNP